jgi:hypothetical protein|tara:strand:+ start:10124 stop:10237 length:114 start_codon:yes stop_codon:yes gene_type:complete
MMAGRLATFVMTGSKTGMLHFPDFSASDFKEKRYLQR